MAEVKKGGCRTCGPKKTVKEEVKEAPKAAPKKK